MGNHGVLHTCQGQPNQLIRHKSPGHHGKAFAHIACARRLDGRVDVGQDVGGDASGGDPAVLTIEPGVIVFGNSGDDYLVVSLDDGPKLHTLYNTAKLNPDQVERFPKLADLIHSPFDEGGKAVISLYPDRKAQIASVISAMANVDGEPVSLGTSLAAQIADVKAELDAGKGVFQSAAPQIRRLGQGNSGLGAKFVRP